MTDAEERLNKHLALTLGLSRREADDLIDAGKVVVNGTTARLGSRVSPDDTIVVDGEPLAATTEYRYVLLNKPKGYVCSRRAQGDNPTIYELLPEDMYALKPVGRLDKDSSGVLLLTNDGDLAHSMTHPKFYKVKIYEVTLDKALEPLHQQMISDYGIEIGDGTSKLSLERIGDDRKKWTITMHEGRNRQIRRTFASLGYDIMQLNRTNFGPYGIGDLTAGSYASTKPL